MTFGRYTQIQKEPFETDLQVYLRVCQKVEVVGKICCRESGDIL